jgi:phosphoglycerate dehydrogenase-like enzyme
MTVSMQQPRQGNGEQRRLLVPQGECAFFYCKRRRLNGRTLGLVGLGRIGMAVALRAKAFSLNVVFYDPYVEYGRAKALGITQVTSLDRLLEVSDILSIHCPLVHNNKSNKHLINKENISHIKKGAFFINTARGAIVEEEALVTALTDGTIQQAAVDVFEKEPYIKGPLLDLPNVILTPHCSFYSDQGVVEMRTKAALEVKRLLTGGS